MTPSPLAIVLAAALAGSSGFAHAQIASWPAADWVRVLDNPERLAAMKIDEVVAALRLAAVGFKPVEDVQLFTDKWFVIYGR